MTTTENEYYLRTTLLIMKGGVFATRKILNRQVASNGGDLNVLLLSNRRKLEHEFHKKQYEKLFPFSGETNVDVWDIAMLTGVLLIVFKPTLCDKDRDAIRAIKSNRNEVSAHNPTASLSIDTFEYCRDELEKAITQLCSTFDDTIKKECKDIINNCLNGALEIKSCLESMKSACDTDDLFRAIMAKFDSTGKQLSEEITSAKKDICKAVHDEQEKQTSEIRNMVIEAVRKAYHEGRIMKTVKGEDYKPKQKTFRLPIRCESFGGLEHIWNLFEGHGSKNLEKLAIAMSAHLGTTITLTSAVNVGLFLNAFEEEGLIERAFTKEQVFTNAVKKFLHMTGPTLLATLLYQCKLIPKLAYNCIMDSVKVDTSRQKEEILDDSNRILLHLLRHRFESVSKRRILFVWIFMKIYIHCTRMPMTVPKMTVKRSYKILRSMMVNNLLNNEDKVRYEYVLKTTLATPAITEADLDKKFICITLLQDYYGFKYDQDQVEKDALIIKMSELVFKTRNPLVSEIMYLSRLAVLLYKSCMLTESKILLHGAMCKACFVDPCYEVIDMHYMHVFLNLLQYEQFPSTDSREAVLRSGRIGLEMLTCTKEYHHVYEIWRYMFKLRMVFCLLQLGSSGYLIQSNETVIDEASIVEANSLLEDIARMDSFSHCFGRKNLYYFALVRLCILKSNYHMARFYIHGLLNQLANCYVGKDPKILVVAKSYLKDINDILKSDDSVLEEKEGTQVNSTKEHLCSTSETSDLSVLREEKQASEINEPELKHLEGHEPPIDFSNPEKVLSDLRQLFDSFFNERIVQNPQRKTSRKKKQKTKRRQKDMRDYLDEPSIE
ncbi:uncharacterized protein LOC123529861 [Mercenaria mercenaria]|uniref:uncharacterized protein LOC123529861 n=1 Tax=Mercenaria mercenaria TaxID=6596 RepID=UPI00234EB85F|nr:uncharacterized protein LOC123529861 [Mercenaria mercenaria]